MTLLAEAKLQREKVIYTSLSGKCNEDVPELVCPGKNFIVRPQFSVMHLVQFICHRWDWETSLLDGNY